jgi:feruloyl esterase
MQAALEQWVEHEIAPDAVVATHSTNGVADRSRPLCPCPRWRYSGMGSTDDAVNFRCEARGAR